MNDDAMRRLRAINPVVELPPLTPITTVIPDWEAMHCHEPAGPVGEVGLRRSPRRWARVGSVLVPGLGVMVAVLVAVIAIATIHSPGRAPRSVASSPAGTYADPEGWSVSYPAGFTLKRSSSGAQVTLSSFAPARTVAGQPTPRQALSVLDASYTLPLAQTGRFPADGVALILLPFNGAIIGPDSRFPINISQFGPAATQPLFSAGTVQRDGIPPARTDPIVAYSREVTAIAIIGRHASPALRSELATVIKSLAFRHLPAGSDVGSSYIVGAASRFTVGSLTRIEAHFPRQKPTAVYIVRAPGRFTVDHSCPKTGSCTAPGAFYGIGEHYNTRLDHAPNCQIQFDRHDQQFYCTNLGVRWDRVGRVVKQPANERYIGAIVGYYAKITWDGQIMITPGWGPQLSRSAVHQLWPHWHQPQHPNLL